MRLLFSNNQLVCEVENINFQFTIRYLLSVVESASLGAQNDLHDAKMFFIQKIEEDLATDAEISGSKSAEFKRVYREIEDLWKELHQDNINYKFGEEIIFSQEKFNEILQDLRTKLEKLI